MIRKAKLLLFIFLFASSSSLFATHFLGYDMQLINIKDANNNPTSNYKWRMRFYRDAAGIPLPFNLTFKLIQSSNNTVVNTFTITRVNAQTFITYPDELCLPSETQNKVEIGIYESSVLDYSNLNDAAGYYATCNHCCRNSNISNLESPSSSINVIFYASIPKLSTGSATQFNSSPYFNTLPSYGFSIGKYYTIDWSATDPDGDSLVYSLVKGYGGDDTKPNIEEIPFGFGYSLNYMVDGNPSLKINSSTGIMTLKPIVATRYLIAVKIEEYRKIGGVPTKIGEVRREMQIQTYLNEEQPPVLYDVQKNSTVIDTLIITSTLSKTINFNSTDQVNDSVFTRIIPEIGATFNNILDTNLIDAAWSDTLGNTTRGANAEQFVIRGKGSTKAILTINADTNSVSAVPYRFKVVSYDQSCFIPLSDTLNYVLYVLDSPCYSTFYWQINACDSFVDLNGKVYYQSTILRDTVLNPKGCNFTNVRSISVNETPTASFDNLNIYVTDTSQTYSYKVDSQNNATYHWNVSSNGTIIGAANKNSISIKWNTDTAMGDISCFVYRENCFDSVYSPIVISHLVGIQNEMSNLQVYPNPVNDVLMFNTTDNLDRALISIYNTMGQKIAEASINNNYADVSTLVPGLYTFTVLHQGKLYRGKFVK